MNVTARLTCGGDEGHLRLPVAEEGILGLDSLSGSALPSAAFRDSKGRKSGIGRRGLAGSSPRASDKNPYTIQGEGLKEGQFHKKGLPYRFSGSVR